MPLLWALVYAIHLSLQWGVINAEQPFATHETQPSDALQEDYNLSCSGLTENSEVQSCQADVLLQRSFSSRSHTETVVTETTVVRTTKTRTIDNIGEDYSDLQHEVSDGADYESDRNFKDTAAKHDPPIDKHFVEKLPQLQPEHEFDKDFPKDHHGLEDGQGSSKSEEVANTTGPAAGFYTSSSPITQMAQNSVEDGNGTTRTTTVHDKLTLAPGYEEDLPVIVVTQSPQVVQKQKPQLAACSYNAAALITVPIEQPCSAACPFSQRIPGDKCHKVCIKKEDCAAFNPKRGFAEMVSKQCMPACGYGTHIIGCSRCAGVGVCVECMTGFTLVENGTRCQNSMEGVWKKIYIILLIVILLLVWYLWNLARRVNLNQIVLEMCFQHRDHCKCWELVADESAGHRWQKYPLWGTHVQSRDIGGLGIVLYFRQLAFLMATCPVLLLAAYVTYKFSDLKLYEDATAHLNDCNSALSHSQHFNGGQFEIDIMRFSHYMFYAMIATYLVFLVGIAMFAKSQLNLATRWDESRSTHEDYAFLCRDLPQDATDPKEIQDYFQELLDNHSTGGADSVHRIVGVSIAYDYKQDAELIDSAICDLVEELEKHRWKSHPSGHFQRIAQALVKSQRWYHDHSIHPHADDADKVAEEASSEAQPQRQCCTMKSLLKLEMLDCLFWGSCGDHDPGHTNKEQVVEVLQNLKGSGNAYVIVDHPSTLTLLSEIGKQPHPPFRGHREIRICDVISEPPSVIWENFTEMNFWPRIIGGCFLIIFTILLWVALYVPYAVLIGEHTGWLQGLLLGLLIAVGNVIVAQVVDLVTKWAGFRRKDRRDMAILALAFMATVMNTICDVFVVLRITNSSGGSSHDFDKVLAPEMFAMIVPGYLILPYLFVPLAENIAPYFIGKWLVRSRKATLRASERCLTCPDFDICWRYSDVLNNFTVCILMLFIVSAETYQVMMWLMLFLALIYVIDKYKLLRQTSQTFYTTRRLDEACLYWWCVPTGLLAAVTTWWACSAGFIPEKERTKMCYIAFGVHIIIYFVLLKLAESFVRPAAPEVLRYSEMCQQLASKGKIWSWFNTNPIFCLRAHYLELKESGPALHPCIPYVPGKQHLQPTAPQHFVHREGADLYKAKLHNISHG